VQPKRRGESRGGFKKSIKNLTLYSLSKIGQCQESKSVIVLIFTEIEPIMRSISKKTPDENWCLIFGKKHSFAVVR
jgi:hypothetical protein